MSEPKCQPTPESNDATISEASIHNEARAACLLAADLFRDFGMKPTLVACPGDSVEALAGEIGGERHVMFIHLDTSPPVNPRQALEPSPEERALAGDLRATPHVLRYVLGVPYRHRADGNPFHVSGDFRSLDGLLGASRFQYHVARSNGYARSLRGRVTVAGHLSRLDGHLSRLRLGIIRTDIQLALRLWIDEREPASEFPGYKPRRRGWEIRCCPDAYALLRLSSANGKDTFVNCSCGEPECMGFRKGFTAVHEGPLTLWKIDILKGRHIYVFDRVSLRREILRGVGALIRAQRSDPGKILIPHFSALCLEEKLADARRNAPADVDDPEYHSFSWIVANSVDDTLSNSSEAFLG